MLHSRATSGDSDGVYTKAAFTPIYFKSKTNASYSFAYRQCHVYTNTFHKNGACYFNYVLITSVGRDYYDSHQNKMAAPLNVSHVERL